MRRAFRHVGRQMLPCMVAPWSSNALLPLYSEDEPSEAQCTRSNDEDRQRGSFMGRYSDTWNMEAAWRRGPFTKRSVDSNNNAAA
jgi:hypothetical protein